MLSFQLQHTEISTDQPSVSGRLLLHIPKIAGKKFHFVSLAVHLRLKESIAWTRQDLVTFEIDKQDWSQTVWERKIILPFQDRQVDEGNEEYVAVVKEPSKMGGYGGKDGRTKIVVDEWRWDWLVPVAIHEVRPASFEGAMGNIWYELEAKCLFRWDEVGSPSKAKLLAEAFGKLRASPKSKKIKRAGDFKIGSRHDEYVENSLRMRNSDMAERSPEQSGHRKPFVLSSSKSHSSPQLGLSTGSGRGHSASEPLPFLVRKLLKLYFVKPLPATSSSPAVPLPQPSMAPLNPHGTRRLKAIIPGARIQVQVQIPSQIPIRGYAQTSQLVPDPKKGRLVVGKSSQSHQPQHNTQQQNRHSLDHHHCQLSDRELTDFPYLDRFQVALTVHRVTQHDINKNDILKKRYQTSTGSSSISPFASVSDGKGYTTGTQSAASLSQERIPTRSRTLSDISFSEQNGEETNPEIKVDSPDERSFAGGSDGAWRKEIRVRKVRCEFWQKETCRIPSNSVRTDSSRSIKYELSPAFTYLEQEQEQEQEQGQERTRSSLHLQSPVQQTTAISWKSNGSSDAVATLRQHSVGSLLPSALPDDSSSQKLQTVTESLSPLLPPTSSRRSDRKGSVSSMARLPSPFMILIPVLLDSPKLRQSFAWPTTETPSPTLGELPSAVLDVSKAQGSPASVMTTDYPTTQDLYGMALRGTDADSAANFAAANAVRLSSTSELPGPSLVGTTVGGHPVVEMQSGGFHPHHHAFRDRLGQYSHSSAQRTRIELKHYLSIRLSIDMLEFEGEPEEDEDLDWDSLEAQQQRQAKARQNVHGFYQNQSVPSYISSASAEAKGEFVEDEEVKKERKNSINSGLSSLSTSSHTSNGTSITALTGPSIPTEESWTKRPVLTSLDSTAGLLSIDASVGLDIVEGDTDAGSVGDPGMEPHGPQVSKGMKASTSGEIDAAGSGPKGLVAGAFETIKKKASSAGLSSVAHIITGRQTSVSNTRRYRASSEEFSPRYYQQPAANQLLQDQSRHPYRSDVHIKVQKLKDFVIRVPINIVMQLEEDPHQMGMSAQVNNEDSAVSTSAALTGSETESISKPTMTTTGELLRVTSLHSFDEDAVEGRFSDDEQ
ncbi:hypothetical protein BGX28_004849 [Mortierella sp. GBA30]|nr:hypothetical protein BGX28_004849 [Mortierella sp. GBA30]